MGTDDRALAMAANKIEEVIERSIKEADPVNAQKLIDLRRATNAQYAADKKMLPINQGYIFGLMIKKTSSTLAGQLT